MKAPGRTPSPDNKEEEAGSGRAACFFGKGKGCGGGYLKRVGMIEGGHRCGEGCSSSLPSCRCLCVSPRACGLCVAAWVLQ